MGVFKWELSLQSRIEVWSRPVLRPLRWFNLAFGGAEVVAWVPIMAVGLAVVSEFSLVQCLAVAVASLASKEAEFWTKVAFNRPRPNGEGLGLPSGDVWQATIWAVPVFGWTAIVPIGLVAWARLARNAHFPLDVVAGAGFGLLALVPWFLARGF